MSTMIHVTLILNKIFKKDISILLIINSYPPSKNISHRSKFYCIILMALLETIIILISHLCPCFDRTISKVSFAELRILIKEIIK